MKYLLPCDECGEKTPIDISQAGQQMSCQCGQMLAVPSLRGIRELEVLDDVEDTAVPRPMWSVGRRVVFVIGLVVCVLGLAALCITSLARMAVAVPERTVTDVKQISAEIDAQTPAETLDTWTNLRTEGLAPYYPAGRVLAQYRIGVLQTAMAIAGGVAIAGVLMSVGSWLFPGARRSR